MDIRSSTLSEGKKPLKRHRGRGTRCSFPRRTGYIFYIGAPPSAVFKRAIQCLNSVPLQGAESRHSPPYHLGPRKLRL